MAFFRSLLLPLLVLIAGCSTPGPEPSNLELLAGSDSFGKTYQINRIELELGTLIPRTCVTDNFITYFPSGRYEINEGATKCDPDAQPAVTGNWSLNERTQLLTVTINDSIQFWAVESLNERSHSITSTFREGDRTYSLNSSK